VTFVLAVPGELIPPPPDLEIRPKAFSAWVEALPIAQTFDASRRLGGYLAQLNGVRLAPDVRAELLDASLTRAQVLLDELDDIYAKAPQPLGPRGREALASARSLAAALATGYRIAAADVAARRIGFGLRKQLATCLVRAAQFLAWQTYASYKAYSPVPQGAWKALHEVYLFAEREQLVNDAGEHPDGLTVAQAYCEALLVSLTDAYRLATGEIERIVALIRALRAPVTLSQQRPATRPGGHFLVPCDTDRGPKPALSANDDAGGPNWRLFDANAIVERVRARKLALEGGNVSASMTREMGEDGASFLAKLVVLWGDPPKRAYRRDPSDMTVAICVGIKAIAHFVIHDSRIDASTRELAVRRGITVQMPALAMDEHQRPVPIHEWAVVNQSAGGLKVRRAQGSMQQLAVGEIVGVRVPGKKHWTVAVLRWITTLEDGSAEFGLQYIGAAERAVWVQATISASLQSKPGLLIADEDSPGAYLLATPSNTYSELREFDLQAEGFSARVRAAGVIELTGRFDLFHLCAS